MKKETIGMCFSVKKQTIERLKKLKKKDLGKDQNSSFSKKVSNFYKTKYY